MRFAAGSSVRRLLREEAASERLSPRVAESAFLLPFVATLGNLFVFATSPVAMAYSRHQEHEADRFALELTRDNRAGATAFLKMQQENLGVFRPGLLIKLWRSTHPPLGERIDFCNDYHPWREGKPGRYETLFRRPPP